VPGKAIAQPRAACWLRDTVPGTGSRHPCRDDADRGSPRSPSFRQDAGTQCHGWYLAASSVPQASTKRCRCSPTPPAAADLAARRSVKDAGTQCQAGPSRNRGRCAGCGLPSLALGPGILPGRRRSRFTAARRSGRMPEPSAMDGTAQPARCPKHQPSPAAAAPLAATDLAPRRSGKDA